MFNDNEIGKPRYGNKVFKLERIYNDSPIKGNNSHKLLGIYLDEHLSFHFHCNHVKNKVAQSNFIISRAKNFLPQSSPLYYALVHPHLLYCLPIYACTTAKNINMLELLQRKAIRNITQTILPTLHQCLIHLKIMPLKHLISYTQSLLVYYLS